MREISDAKADPKEEDELNTEHQRASNASELIETAQHAINILEAEGDSLIDRLDNSASRSSIFIAWTKARAGWSRCEQVNSLLQDLRPELDSYAEQVDVDPGRLMELNDRVELLQGLKQIRPEIADVIELANARENFTLESRDVELERLTELAALAQIAKAGSKITRARKAVIDKLGKAVVSQLRDLGFKQSHFAATLMSLESRLVEFDRVEFRPNVGEPPQSCGIASSGEMARVMLAIKTVLAAEDRIPVLVFDEVDANVGEKLRMVGEKMGNIQKPAGPVYHPPTPSRSGGGPSHARDKVGKRQTHLGDRNRRR